MTEKEQIQNQIKVLEDQLTPLKEKLKEIWLAEEKDVDEKIKLCHQGKGKFNEDELVFAAFERCSCGAGMAYPKNTSIQGHWECSSILLGLALPQSKEGNVSHTPPLPFSVVNIKSEDQPSANGCTTRLKKE